MAERRLSVADQVFVTALTALVLQRIEGPERADALAIARDVRPDVSAGHPVLAPILRRFDEEMQGDAVALRNAGLLLSCDLAAFWRWRMAGAYDAFAVQAEREKG